MPRSQTFVRLRPSAYARKQRGASLQLPILVLTILAVVGIGYSWHLSSKRKALQEKNRQEEMQKAALKAEQELALQQAQLAALANQRKSSNDHASTPMPSVPGVQPASPQNNEGMAKSAEQLYAELAKSTALIQVFNSSGQRTAIGSGVVIDSGIVITNCHVTRAGIEIKVQIAGQNYPAKVMVADEVYDLCKLQGSSISAPAVRMGSADNLRIGQKVYALGAPQGLELTISDGIISSLRSLNESGKLIQTTTPISPGSSGGGLYDSSGQLVGITTFQHRSGQNLNFAVPVDWIRSMQNRKSAGVGVGGLTIDGDGPGRGRPNEANSASSNPNSKIAGAWVCFSPITGNGFEMSMNPDGTIEAFSDNKKLYGRYVYDGKNLSLSGNGVLTGVVEELTNNKFVINYQRGVRLVCNRKSA